MSSLYGKIRSRGYWRVVIRPQPFVEKRISQITELYPILQNTSVQLRGWDFPHLDPHIQTRVDIDWIGQESDWEHFLEIWRFYQSGQFIDITGMDEDWYDQRHSIPAALGDWRPGSILGIGNTLFRFTEIFEFASRLAMTQAGDDIMRVEITVSNLEGRKLWVDSSSRMPIRYDYVASISEFPYQIELSRSELIAAPRELALKPAIELFRRFGWDPSQDMLRDHQKELRR